MKKCTIFFFLILAFHQLPAYQNSMLSAGQWYKFSISETGIYRINYNDIAALGFNNMANIKIYGYGGKQLSYWNSDERPNDLTEIPVKLFKGNDGVFNSGDYLLCYLEGPRVKEYSSGNGFYKKAVHQYSTVIHYFITVSSQPTKEIPFVNLNTLTPEINFTTGNWDGYFEEELFNPIKSGRIWYGDDFNADGVTHAFTAENILSNSPVLFEIAAIARNRNTQEIQLSINDNIVQTKSIGGVRIDDRDSRYAYDCIFDGSTKLNTNEIAVKLQYTGSDNSDQAFLNYIALSASVNLKHNNKDVYSFYNLQSKNYSVKSYNIEGLPNTAMVWDLTDIHNVRELQTSTQGSGRGFVDNKEGLRHYAAILANGSYKKPKFDGGNNGWVKNQNLRGVEPHNLVIVTHPAFKEAAEELAQWHRDKDDLSVFVVSPQTIYNDFSSGTRDISAIRDFLKYMYEKTTDDNSKLKYLLLFGDGSYNNMSDHPGNTNYIPTYQSPNSLVPTSSYVSDDFFGLLDDSEGEVSGKLDIGIGRFPVRSDGANEAEAWTMVDKIKTYYDASYRSDWCLRVAFLADDAESGWELDFMKDSDSMAQLIQSKKPEYNIEKLYCDAYEQVTSSTGAAYPSVKEAATKVLSKGVLVFNYMGHGNENSMTEEKVLQKQDIENLENAPYFPLIITASCQVGRFDHVEVDGQDIVPSISAGEAALLNPNGGGIAMLTTTRLVFQSANYSLNRSVYKYLFNKTDDGCYERLGDVIRKAKNENSSSNKLNFALLGDPAIKLAIPENIVLIDTVNSHSVNNYTDTLSAFQEVHLSGRVVTNDSITIEDFNGTLSLNIFDKEVSVTTKSNHGQGAFTYADQKNLIYKGKASINGGHFKTSFRVPKDISYNFGAGKISVYAEDSLRDASGYTKNIVIGGTSGEGFVDIDGPQIGLYLNNNRFQNGDMAGPNPIIYAEVFDESGINTTGLGIGHDITAYLQEDAGNTYVLNDFYEANLDDYRRGIVKYQLYDLEEGNYTLHFKVWDINNNSSESSISFTVVSDNNLMITNLQNTPNPVTNITQFQYQHNLPGMHYVTLNIYDLGGRLIYKFKRSNMETGYISEPIDWQIGNSGLKSGIYPYSIKVETDEGKSAIINQKLIILR